jgi:large subunit ribosomal protein L22
MEVRAILRNMGVPARKVRLVIDAVKGMPVNDAIAYLRFIPNASAKPMRVLLESAAANAENNYALDRDDLYVVQLVADEAPTIKRGRIRSRGRYSHINKRHTHITVILSDEYDLIPREYRKKHPQKQRAR